MKRKLIITSFFTLLFSISICSAQGLYNNTPKDKETTKKSDNKRIGLRAEGDGRPEVTPGNPGETNGPVSDTLWVFLLGATIYYGFKKRAAIKE